MKKKRKGFAEGGAVDEPPVYKYRDYTREGGKPKSPADFNYTLRQDLKKNPSLSLDEQKDRAREGTLRLYKAYGEKLGDEGNYPGYRKGGVVKKKK